MTSISSCLYKVFCCGCCRKKKLRQYQAHSASEVKVNQISHGRFVSTEVISIGTALRES